MAAPTSATRPPLWQRHLDGARRRSLSPAVRDRLRVFFAFNGTAAQLLALAALCQSYHSVICSDTAHVETDECGAPEFFSNGSKLLLAPAHQGKQTPGAHHRSPPSAPTSTFPSRGHDRHPGHRGGTLYSLNELQAISATCREPRPAPAHGRLAFFPMPWPAWAAPRPR